MPTLKLSTTKKRKNNLKITKINVDNLSENGLIEIKGWDGTNSDPSSNFYVYKILGIRINDEVVTKTGTIFLIE